MTLDQSPELISPGLEATEVLPTPPPPGEVQPAVIDPDNPPWAWPSWLGVLKAVGTWIGSVLFLLFVPLVLVIPYFIYLFSTTRGP
ncbi:MAG TPA: hypothetical protein VF074_08440, partial [Pyrinomonadaceae bacterium]